MPKKADSPMVYMLIGQDVPFRPQSLLAGQTHEMHLPIYRACGGEHNQAAMEFPAEDMRRRVAAIHGGEWRIHWASPEVEAELMRDRLKALVADSVRRSDHHHQAEPPVAIVRGTVVGMVPVPIVDPGATSQADVTVSPLISDIDEDEIPF